MNPETTTTGTEPTHFTEMRIMGEWTHALDILSIPEVVSRVQFRAYVEVYYIPYVEYYSKLKVRRHNCVTRYKATGLPHVPTIPCWYKWSDLNWIQKSAKVYLVDLVRLLRFTPLRGPHCCKNPWQTVLSLPVIAPRRNCHVQHTAYD